MDIREKITVITSWLQDVPNRSKEARKFMEELANENSKLSMELESKDKFLPATDVVRRLKIIKCKHPDYWYKHFIGHEFEIKGHNSNSYDVVREYDGFWYVHGMDVEICQ